VAALSFLFTDIEGSTRLWELHPEAMRKALGDHDDLLRKLVESHDGRVFKHSGDGAFCVFGMATDALAAAADAQRRFGEVAYPDIGPLRLRMAIHTGEVEEREGDFFGQALNRTARLLSVAHGGQVVVSLVAQRIAGSHLPVGVALRDLGEHRLRDLAGSERIYQLDVEGVAGRFPPLRTPDLVPNNLPTFVTSFVGRQQELDEVKRLIGATRVLTITGVGGSGKTRLAIQAAADLGDEFPGGTWLIELGAVTDPDLIDATAADALGVGQAPGRTIREAIVEHLAGRVAFLVVDNCEHLIAGAAEFVSAIVSGAPECRVVATSRELLGVSGEVAYGMPSLAMPQRGEQVPVAALEGFDAVRLFVERARASQPGFHLTEAMAPSVIEICRRLDGMPLALELAAARLRTFTPHQIAENLDQRFRLLTGGSRTALPRQQTLAAAIDWSYRLLDEPERRLFERLSVFQGGFTLEAVEEVCTASDLDRFAVLELLPALVDKSLVAVDTAGVDARYRLLETLRQFARDRLDESSQADEFRRRHAAFFRELATEAGHNIRGPHEVTWWERIDAELDNLRQAMTWAVEAGEGDLALTIAGGFWRFWWFKSRWSEGVSWLEQTVAAAGEDASRLVRAQGLLGLGSLLGGTDRHPESVPLLLEAVRLYEELDASGADPALLRQGYAAALINLSASHESAGQFDQMVPLNTQALAIARRIDDRAAIAVALGNLAEAAGRAGDAETARQRFVEAIAASMELRSTHRLTEQYWQAGFFELSMEEPASAQQHFRRGIEQAEAGRLDDYARCARAFLGVCDAELGDPEASRRFVQHAAEAFANPELRVNWLPQVMLVLRAGLDVAAGDFENAGRALGVVGALEGAGTALWWTLSGRRARILDSVMASLGPDRGAAAMAAGAALDGDAVIELITRPI
jgi:predicted ATPase/class 3 adenylate cyclase